MSAEVAFFVQIYRGSDETEATSLQQEDGGDASSSRLRNGKGESVVGGIVVALAGFDVAGAGVPDAGGVAGEADSRAGGQRVSLAGPVAWRRRCW